MMMKNFAGQWLRLRNVVGQQPDDVLFPNFNDNLRHDFVKETELFFAAIIREDRSILDLLDADFTFVNGRLAKHYGISGVYGEEFQRVKLGDSKDDHTTMPPPRTSASRAAARPRREYSRALSANSS